VRRGRAGASQLGREPDRSQHGEANNVRRDETQRNIHCPDFDRGLGLSGKR